MEKITPILITGAQGFVGRNLTVRLQALGYRQLRLADRHTSPSQLAQYVQEAGMIFHLAGENRPKDPQAFITGNVDSLSQILAVIPTSSRRAPIVLASSLQAEQDNPYGKSKKTAEETLIAFGKKHQHPYVIYRFSHIFGKWSKPNYNSVVATFCYNVSRQLPIQIHNPLAKIHLIYIDDVVDELIRYLEGQVTTIDGILRVLPEYEITVGELASTIQGFQRERQQFLISNQLDSLTKKLYATYISFLDPREFGYDVASKIDARGSFSELFKTPTHGQVSVNITKPGITKGNHYHNTKTEKFITVSGQGKIRLRAVNQTEVTEILVDGQHLKIVDIPPGYIHSLVNTGAIDLVTIMWASETFDPNIPDTYPMEVDV
jgi:UDP-2-acetamido-2,6-beta-L-arabino-hexul-4-ose reductase